MKLFGNFLGVAFVNKEGMDLGEPKDRPLFSVVVSVIPNVTRFGLTFLVHSIRPRVGNVVNENTFEIDKSVQCKDGHLFGIRFPKKRLMPHLVDSKYTYKV